MYSVESAVFDKAM